MSDSNGPEERHDPNVEPGGGAMNDFWCPQCGKGVKADEDGTCYHCGADLILEQVWLAIRREALELAAERACALFYLEETTLPSGVATIRAIIRRAILGDDAK